MKERAKRRRGIDYNKEVAFEKKPAMGFFDTGAEQDRTKEIGQEFRPTTLEDMEGRRRKVCNQVPHQGFNAVLILQSIEHMQDKGRPQRKRLFSWLRSNIGCRICARYVCAA